MPAFEEGRARWPVTNFGNLKSNCQFWFLLRQGPLNHVKSHFSIEVQHLWMLLDVVGNEIVK